MKYFRTVRDSSKEDVLSLANLSITTVNKMVYLLLAILTGIILVLGLYGFNTIRDAEKSYKTKVEKPIESIQAIALESELLKDSLKVILDEVKLIQSIVDIASTLAKNSLNQSNAIYDSLKLRLKNTNALENSIKKFKSKLLDIDDEFKSQNKQIISLSKIFNNVAAENQTILNGRERFLMYLLAYQIEKKKM